MSNDIFSLDQLNDMKFNLCCRMDAYLGQAGEFLCRINAFNSLEERASAPASESSSAALVYLHRRFSDVMKEFDNCNADLLRLEQIIQEKSHLIPPKKRIPEASDEEFLARLKEQYVYQMFNIACESEYYR